MMNFLKALLIGIISAIITIVLMRAANWDGSSELKLASQPAFDRVMQSHTLRCIRGFPAPAFTAADPERDLRRKMSQNIIEQMGHILDIDIEWVEDVPPNDVADHLARGKEDALCFPIWPDSKRAATMEFTSPIDYMPLFAVVRADDVRFDGNLAKIDDAGVMISVIDGAPSKNITEEDFMHAKQYTITGETDMPHLFLAVSTKKADVAFADPISTSTFMKNNPGVIKYVPSVPPVRVFGEYFAVAKGETKLRDMMNVALEQMQNSGFMRGTLDKYESEHKGEFYYVARPWE